MRTIDRLLKAFLSDGNKQQKKFIFGFNFLPQTFSSWGFLLEWKTWVTIWVPFTTFLWVKCWEDLQWNHSWCCFLEVRIDSGLFARCFVVLTPHPKWFCFWSIPFDLKEISSRKGVDINISERLFKTGGTLFCTLQALNFCHELKRET